MWPNVYPYLCTHWRSRKLRLTTVGDPQRWPRDTPPSTKVGNKFRSSCGGRSGGIVRLRTQGHGVCLCTHWIGRQSVHLNVAAGSELLIKRCRILTAAKFSRYDKYPFQGYRKRYNCRLSCSEPCTEDSNIRCVSDWFTWYGMKTIHHTLFFPVSNTDNSYSFLRTILDHTVSKWLHDKWSQRDKCPF
jgi:hypothetical protein